MAALPSPATPPTGGIARRPVAVVRLNGAELAAWLSVKTTNNAHSQADTFEVTIPLQTQPEGANWAGWGGDDSNPEIEVLYGLLDAQGNRMALASAVLGPVDKVRISQARNVAVLTGRDYSGALIDTQSFGNYTNQTASQIATQIAESHGLTAQVQATTIPVGAKDEGTGQYSRVTRRESEWDFLTSLARNEGFACYVRGRTLYFQPDQPPSGTPYGLAWTPAKVRGGPPSANFISIELERALTLARDIVVNVVSHHAGSAKTVTGMARSKGGKATGKAQVKPQTYTIDIPGLTQDQADQRAAQLLNQYSQFERVISVDLPGDPYLSFEQPLHLASTGTSWDGPYYADRIERELSMQGGFKMKIRAKNHPTGQTETVGPGGK